MSGGGAKPPTVYMHIGPPKTGTTYIQETLRRWHRDLRAEGVLYPLRRPGGTQVDAALDARGDLGYALKVGEHSERTHARGAWRRLLNQARSFDGTVVISHELFATSDDEHARAAVADLRDFDLHLVLTVRDPARQIVSSWQQRVRQGGRQTFGSMARGIRERRRMGPAQELSDLLERWASTLPPDHVHIVTVPPTGSPPGLLWQRFASVVGIDAERFDSAGTVRANESLGWAEVETLRRVIVALEGRISRPQYSRIVNKMFARGVLGQLATTSKPSLPSNLASVADEIADRWIKDVTAGGYDVIGDLDDLRPRHPNTSSTAPGDTEVAEVAVRATAALLVDLARRDRSADRFARRRVKRLTKRAATRLRVRPVLDDDDDDF
jgi:hypothetical protein